MTQQTFYQWLAQFRKQDNAIGDLARDAVEDYCFPKKSRNRETIMGHVVNGGGFLHPTCASDRCVATLVKALDRYEKESRK
jgi:uncharacterized protein YozE (UPF0346 family)